MKVWSAVSLPGDPSGQFCISVLRFVQTRGPKSQAKYFWSRKTNLLQATMLCGSLSWPSERLFRAMSFFPCTHIRILQNICITDVLIDSNLVFALAVNIKLCNGDQMGSSVPGSEQGSVARDKTKGRASPRGIEPFQCAKGFDSA